MRFEKEIFLHVSQFIKHPTKKILLLVGEVENFSQCLLRQSEQEKFSTFHIDLSKPFEFEKLSAHDVMVFDNWGENGEIENIYVKYQLDRFATKFIFICRESLLHPTLDPGIYFSPIKGGRVQRHLLSKLILPAPKAKESTMKQAAAVVEQTSPPKPTVLWHQKLMTQDAVMMQMLADNVMKDEKFKDFLFRAVYASRDDDQMQVAAANAITGLNYARISFSQMDLSGIKISYADLSYGIFDSTQFKAADLRHVNFTGAWLARANLSNSQLGDIKFGELPSLVLPESCEKVCYSPCSEWIAIGKNQEVILHDAITLDLKIRLELLSKDTLTGISFGGDELLAVSTESTIQVFDLKSREAVRSLKRSENKIVAMEFNPNGKEIAFIQNDIVALWNLESGDLSRTFELTDRKILKIIFNRDGSYLAVACYVKEEEHSSSLVSICVWDVQDNKIIQTLLMALDEFSAFNTLALEWSPHGQYLVAGVAGGGFGVKNSKLHLWKVKTAKLRTFADDLEITSLAFSPDEKHVASGGASDNVIHLWNVESGEEIDVLYGHAGPVNYLSFSKNGERLISASANGEGITLSDNTVKQWSIKTRGHSRLIIEVNNIKRVESLSMSPTLIQSPEAMLNFRRVAADVTSTVIGRRIAYSSDNKYKAVVEEKKVAIFLISTGKLIWALDVCNIACVALNQHQIMALMGVDGTLTLWQIDTQMMRCSLTAYDKQSEEQRCIAFSPDGQKLAVGSFDKAVQLWDVVNGKLLRNFITTKPVLSVAFSHDNQYIASGHVGSGNTQFDGTDIICLWSATTYRLEKLINIKEVIWLNWPHKLAFSPDNKFLVVASASKTISIVELATGSFLYTSPTFNQPMVSVTWFQNSLGDFLLTGCEDGNVSYWQIYRDERTFQIILLWNTFQTTLVLKDINIFGCNGLSSLNHNVIKQKGNNSFNILQDLDAKVVIEETRVATEMPVSTDSDFVESAPKEISSSQIPMLDANTLSQRLLRDDKEIIDAFVTRVQHDKTFEQLLVDWLHASKNNPELEVVAANAISILVKAGVNFNGNDLREINIRGADLSYGVFDRADFTGADLRDVKFLGAYLRQAKFNKCQMTGTMFGEQSPLVHKGVRHICCSSDGKLLASAGEDKIIRLWRIENKQCLKILIGHTDRIFNVRFSRCDKLLISASQDTTIRIWDVTTGKCVKLLQCFNSPVWHVRFSPDSKQFVSMSEDNKLRLWEVAAGICIDEITNNASWICNFEFSPNGEYLIWADNKLRKQAVLWKVKTKRVHRILNEHQNAIKQVTFSPDSLCVITGSDDGTMQLWDVAQGQCSRVFVGYHKYIDQMCFSPDGMWIVSASHFDRMVCLWEKETGQCYRIFNERYGSMSLCLLSNQQGLLVINCTLGANDEVAFWEFNPQLFPAYDSSSSAVIEVKLSYDNSWIVSTSENSAIHLWDVTTGKCTKTFVKRDSKVGRTRLSSKNSSLASCDGVDKTVKVWDIPSGKRLVNFSIPHLSKESEVQFSPDLQWFAFSSDAYSNHTVILRKISLDNASTEITLRGHTGEVKQLEFSANNKYLATASTSDKTARVWDVGKKTQIMRIDKFPYMFGIMKFSPDEKLLAVVIEESDYQVLVLNIITQQVVMKINSAVPNYPFHGLKFSFNNQWLAITDCKNVQLWDIASRKCLAELKCKYCRKVYFSPDNQWLLVTRDGGEVWWWDTEKKFLRGIIYTYSGDVCDIRFSSASQSVVIGSEDGIQVWEWKISDFKLEFKLKWSSKQKILCLKEITFDGATGLTETQLSLLKQRGANYECALQSRKMNDSQCEVILPEVDSTVDANQEKQRWGNYGVSLFNYCQYSIAIICFNNALTLDPRFPIGLQNKGYSHVQLGQYQEAIKCYDMIFSVDPEYYKTNAILRLKGSVHFYSNNFEEALGCFNELLRKSGNKAIYSACYKGFIFLLEKDYQGAEKLFDEILVENPHFYLVLLGKGLVYQVKYANLQLTQLYLQQSKINADKPEEEFEFYFIQGKVFSALGLLKEAELAFDKALLLRPDHMPVQQERAALNDCSLDPSESGIRLHQ